MVFMTEDIYIYIYIYIAGSDPTTTEFHSDDFNSHSELIYSVLRVKLHFGY